MLRRRRPARLAPVRPARGRRAQPRPGAARAGRRLPPRVDRPLAVRGPAPVRDVQQEPVHRARRRAAAVPLDLGPDAHAGTKAAPSTSTRRSSRSSSGGSGTAARCCPRDVGAREAIDWYWRPTNQVRAILEALAEAGTSASPGARATSASTTWPSGCFPRRSCEERRAEEEQQAHRLLSRYRGNGLLGASGNQELWVGGTGYAADRAAAPGGAHRGRAPGPGPGRGAARASGSSSPRTSRSSTRPKREIGADRPPGGVEPASPSSRRSIRCAGTATSCAGCSASTTSGRSTSPRRSGAGATTSCRSCTATASSAGSSRGSSGGPGRSGSPALWWEPGFDPLAEEGFVAAFADALLGASRLRRPRTVALPRDRPRIATAS